MMVANKHLSSVAYWLIYVFVWLISLIPFPVAQFFGRVLGRAFAILGMSRINVSLDNIRHSFGDKMGEAEIKRLNRRVMIHFAEMLFEVPHILRMNRSNLGRYVVFEGQEYFLEALRKGKGVFILTGHFGNWELMSAAVSLCFVPDALIIARPLDFAPVERLVNLLRSRFGAEVIPKSRAMKSMIKAARDNRAVGVLLDQNVDWYEGVFVQFLGRQACTNKGLALIAQRTGSPVVPTFSVRQGDGRYRIIFEKEIELSKTGDKIRDYEDNTAIFTNVIEKYVRKYPDQWFWLHKRWKTKSYCPLPQYFGIEPGCGRQ